ncbi:apolipoprotein N-acyltransferase [Poseidonocella sedimentorum]|uniref:Apolipoprotein N-acyltransferase n=1 Tax=Poseidonocella sedimentorum TaxID=871652 RepID=A0A1I6DQ31_9RHOB|nr:apolipoprotein N-acyltransferase [Poseidonocella sedimentorum]SFR07491.1 apolipoprotein N-acyltransferase [Poseidonocella sedimentorum]
MTADKAAPAGAAPKAARRAARGGRVLAALGAGALAAAGQAPVNLPLLGLAGLVLAVWLFGRSGTVRAALLTGLCTGVGYFAISLAWIVEPFLVDVARHGWMAPFALVLMAGGLALFWAGAFGAARYLVPARGAVLPARAALVGLWTLAELTRAHVLTGFPWAMPSQALVDVIAGQGAALIGPHGLNLALFAAAALIAPPSPRACAIPAGLAAAALLLWPVPPAPPGPEDRPTVRLVQPNAPQDEKWDPTRTHVFLNRALDYTAAPGAPDVIVWPETSVPYLLDYAEPLLADIAEAARGAPVAVGAMRFEGEALHNSLVLVGPEGRVSALYDKHRLVPFGEYMPLAGLAARYGLFGLATDRLGGYTPGARPTLLEIPGIGWAQPLICYEAVFPQQILRGHDRPDLLLQITNDAWFGRISGPYQHLAQARMRSIEQGLAAIRVANTGVSAVIDPQGRIRGQISLGEAGFRDVALPEGRSPTPYARFGDTPLTLAVLALLAATALRRARHSH